MKLLSMTDFVLESAKWQKHRRDKYDILYDYAQFLKQPLELWMFVPCDEDGYVLNYQEIKNSVIEGTDSWDEYQQAKERVFFSGAEVIEDSKKLITIEFENTWIEFNKEYRVFLCNNFALVSLEDISHFTPNLTQTAIKQLK